MIDAECYSQEYLEIEKTILHLNHTKIENEVSTFSKGAFDIQAECYAESGIPFLRIGDLRGMVINDYSLVYIPKSESDKYHKSILHRGDIVLSKTAYPAASLVTVETANTSQDTIAVKLRKNSLITEHYLTIFLNTKYGHLQMRRWFTGNIQMHLNLKDSKNIIIPVFSANLYDQCRDVFERRIEFAQN